MSVVDIPPDPSGGGKIRVQLELAPDELRVSIDLLKAALEKLKARNASVEVASQLASVSLQQQQQQPHGERKHKKRAAWTRPC